MRPDEVVIFTVMMRDFEEGEVQLQLDEICDKAPEITISITVRMIRNELDRKLDETLVELSNFEICSIRHIPTLSRD